MNEREARDFAIHVATRWPDRIQAAVKPVVTRDAITGYTITLKILSENRILRLARISEIPGILDVCSALLDEHLPVTATVVTPVLTQQRGTTLTPEAVCAIRERYGVYIPGKRRGKRIAQQISIRHLAREYRVSRGKILEVVRGEERPMENQELNGECVAMEPTELEPMDLVSEEEAAEILGVKLNTVHSYASGGLLQKYVQSNGEWQIVRASVENYLKNRKGRKEQPEEMEKATELTPTPTTEQPEPKSDPVGEEALLQALITYAFSAIPGITRLPRFTEVPRTWKLDLVTVRGPESYRVTCTPDGSFQRERW